jgi:hypothetical protein
MGPEGIDGVQQACARRRVVLPAGAEELRCAELAGHALLAIGAGRGQEECSDAW